MIPLEHTNPTIDCALCAALRKRMTTTPATPKHRRDTPAEHLQVRDTALFVCPGRHCVGVDGVVTTHRTDALGVIHTLGMPGSKKRRVFR